MINRRNSDCGRRHQHGCHDRSNDVKYTTVTKGADGGNGWTPLYLDRVYGDKVIRMINDYTGGTGDKPAQYIGLYIKDNGYTSNPEEATDYKGANGDTYIPVLTTDYFD